MDEKEFDYMNVIPLVDVMLVLLTIVLTTSTLIASGMINVSLPKASAEHKEILKNQIISIDKGGAVYLNSSVVTLDGLQNKMLLLDKQTPVLIRADRDIRLQVFVDVLDVVKNLEFKRVSLQTEKRKGGMGEWVTN
ncbi:MAG: biopolymer transporter ExbD [Nitrospira sp.]|nr:biopolymer transporter ExbD [Nitrospira sp.]